MDPNEIDGWDDSLERQRYDEYQQLLSEDPGYAEFLDSCDSIARQEETEVHERDR